MGVLLAQRCRRGRVHELVRLAVAGLFLKRDAELGIAHRHAPGAGHKVDARVGTRRTGVELEQDAPPELCPDQSLAHVADLDLEVLAPVVEKIMRVVAVARLLRLHRHEEVKVIAAVDVHVLRDRTESVSRILVAALLGVEVKCPAWLAGLGRNTLAVHRVVAVRLELEVTLISIRSSSSP